MYAVTVETALDHVFYFLVFQIVEYITFEETKGFSAPRGLAWADGWSRLLTLGLHRENDLYLCVIAGSVLSDTDEAEREERQIVGGGR